MRDAGKSPPPPGVVSPEPARAPAAEGTYEPPAVVWEEVLAIENNLQSGCAKFSPQGGACVAASKS